MSGFFQNNKTAIHIASEVVIFGIAMFVIYRRTNNLSSNLEKLENRVRDLEAIIVEQKKTMDKFLTAPPQPKTSYVTPQTPQQQYYSAPQQQQYSAPQQQYSAPQQQQYSAPQRQPVPQQQYTPPPQQPTPQQQQYTPPPQQPTPPQLPTPPQQYKKPSCATIVEMADEDEDDLDKSLEEELKELEK